MEFSPNNIFYFPNLLPIEIIWFSLLLFLFLFVLIPFFFFFSLLFLIFDQVGELLFAPLSGFKGVTIYIEIMLIVPTVGSRGPSYYKYLFVVKSHGMIHAVAWPSYLKGTFKLFDIDDVFRIRRSC